MAKRMEENSILKLIMEKGPLEGETLEFPSGSFVKIGRVIRGNTIGIKDAGISTKHLSIQFDDQSGKWTLSDLDSSNGTILNGKCLRPHNPTDLKDGDCVKIGEFTSIVVKIEVEASSRLRRNPIRQRKAGASSAVVVDRERSELGLGFDGDLGGNAVEKPVEKRNLRNRGKKAADSKEVEILSSVRATRRTKKEEDVSFNSTLNQIPENLIVDERKAEDNVVPGEGKKTRVGGKRGRKKKPPLETVQGSVLEENLNTINEGVLVNAAEVLESRQGALENPVEPPLENVGNINESVPDDDAEELKSRQEGCERKKTEADGSSLKGSSEGAVQGDADISPKLDLEKMTLGDFFDYLEVQLPKEIYDKSEQIISRLTEKARKCQEFKASKKPN